MSATVWDIRIPCDSDPECLHRICHACEQPLRSDKQKKDDHPGAKPGHIFNRLCDRCMIEGHPSIHDLPQIDEPPPVVIADERHVLLSDKELIHMLKHHPYMFRWTMNRRRRLKLSPPIRPNGLPLGVYKSGKKWKVEVRQNGQKYYHGVYDTIDEAAIVAEYEWQKGQR